LDGIVIMDIDCCMQRDPQCVLIDDDEDFLTVAHRFLQIILPEFEVVAFFSGVAALDFLVCHRVDLILTDFRMPLLDGLRLTKAVRSVDRDVPIVIMSHDEIEEQALAHGANAFVLKRRLSSQLGSVLQRLHAPHSGRVVNTAAGPSVA
jgi:two-component system, response regulator YesN